VEGEAIGRFMADIVNLGDRLKAQREETARMDLTAKMIPIMVETVEKFSAMGATPEHIARILQATIEEINNGPR
jgi:archaellum component FlaC